MQELTHAFRNASANGHSATTFCASFARACTPTSRSAWRVATSQFVSVPRAHSSGAPSCARVLISGEHARSDDRTHYLALLDKAVLIARSPVFTALFSHADTDEVRTVGARGRRAWRAVRGERSERVTCRACSRLRTYVSAASLEYFTIGARARNLAGRVHGGAGNATLHASRIESASLRATQVVAIGAAATDEARDNNPANCWASAQR